MVLRRGGLTFIAGNTQYILVNGTRAMSGDLDMGTNDVTNVGLVDGVDVSSHASRHVPGAVDAIATGVPVTLGAVLAEGTAATLARADHVHTHGSAGGGTQHTVATTLSAGFMSATDKSKLDAIAGTAGSVTFYNAGGTNVTEDNANLFYDDTNNRLGVGTNTGLTGKVDVKEATLGNQLVNLHTTSGGAFGDVDYKVTQHRVTTTNNTDTTLATIATTTDTIYLVEARVVCARTAGTDAAGSSGCYIRTARATNIGGTLVIANLQTTFTGDDVGLDATIDASGTDIRVRVNGNATTTYEWHGTVILQKITYV